MASQSTSNLPLAVEILDPLFEISDEGIIANELINDGFDIIDFMNDFNEHLSNNSTHIKEDTTIVISSDEEEDYRSPKFVRVPVIKFAARNSSPSKIQDSPGPAQSLNPIQSTSEIQPRPSTSAVTDPTTRKRQMTASKTKKTTEHTTRNPITHYSSASKRSPSKSKSKKMRTSVVQTSTITKTSTSSDPISATSSSIQQPASSSQSIFTANQINCNFYADEGECNLGENLTCQMIYPGIFNFLPTLLLTEKSTNANLLISKNILSNICIRKKYIISKLFSNSHFTINLDKHNKAILHNELRYGKTYTIVIIINDNSICFSISQWLNFIEMLRI